MGDVRNVKPEVDPGINVISKISRYVCCAVIFFFRRNLTISIVKTNVINKFFRFPYHFD